MPFQTRQRLTWGRVCAGGCVHAGPPLPPTPRPIGPASATEQVQNSSKPLQTNWKAQNKELQERLKVQETAPQETQRKSIDWWFSSGAMVGALAVMFGALPLLLTRQQKADIEKDDICQRSCGEYSRARTAGSRIRQRN